MKELLSDNKKLSTLNQEKTLKGTQEKVVSILGSLTRLWNIMEVEREALPDNDDEATSGHMEIATLFEQNILLIGQAFNAITYHRQLNILNRLIDNSIKVKEILKERNLDLDDMENPYLFGEKFEEKLIKITSAKQKSKSVFTALQQRRKPTFFSRPNYNQPFLSSPLPENQQRGSTSVRARAFFFTREAAARGKNLPSSVSLTGSGNSQSRNILTHTSCKQTFTSSKEFQKFQQAGRLQYFLENWEKLTSDPSILNIAKGYQIPFLSVPIHKSSPPLTSMTLRKKF